MKVIIAAHEIEQVVGGNSGGISEYRQRRNSSGGRGAQARSPRSRSDMNDQHDKGGNNRIGGR